MQEETFELRSDVIDLLQLLKATGYAATGGEAKMMVEDELIAVNGEVEGRKRRKLCSPAASRWTVRPQDLVHESTNHTYPDRTVRACSVLSCVAI